MEFFSLFVSGSFLLLIALSDSYWRSFYISLIVMSITCLARGFEVAGSTLNPTDLAPDHSGLLFGLMNTVAAIAGRDMN